MIYHFYLSLSNQINHLFPSTIQLHILKSFHIELILFVLIIVGKVTLRDYFH
jgi:hypothetical protein